MKILVVNKANEFNPALSQTLKRYQRKKTCHKEPTVVVNKS